MSKNLNEKKRNLIEDKSFLKWLMNSINNGYDIPMGVNELQSLSDNIVSWFEIKYSDKELKEDLNKIKLNREQRLVNYMDFDQLMIRLDNNQRRLLFNQYRCDKASDFGGCDKNICLNIFAKEKTFEELVFVNSVTGVIEFNNLEDKDRKGKKIIIDELPKLLEGIKDIDCEEIQRCINNHNFDLELRNIILSNVALNLINSKNTTFGYGYIRAKLFLKEFNDNLENLNIKFDYTLEFEDNELLKYIYCPEDKGEILKLYYTSS